jgi:hypothetical protein
MESKAHELLSLWSPISLAAESMVSTEPQLPPHIRQKRRTRLIAMAWPHDRRQAGSLSLKDFAEQVIRNCVLCDPECLRMMH